MAKYSSKSYAPKKTTVTIPRPGGVTIGDTSKSNSPTVPFATPALHKQYTGGTRTLKNPKTQGKTSQGKQVS